jgi:hypothetical protein
MDADERLAALEARLTAYDTLVGRLITFARATAKGRLLLKALGL